MKLHVPIAAIFVAALAGTNAGALPSSAEAEKSVERTTVPVFAPRGTAGSHLSVCMSPGIPPRDYPLLSLSCGRDAERCTAFVAMSKDEAEFFIPTYDLERPPIAATNGSCDAYPFRGASPSERPRRVN